LNGTTTTTYDARDNETAVTDPRGLTTTYTYDGLDNLVQQISPDTGTTTYTYDAAGNPTSRTYARGVTVHYTYDALKRLTAIDYPDDGLDVAFTYDTCPNGMGQLCEMRDGSGATTYAYDPRGNLTAQTVTTGGVTQILGYAYNGADQLIRITYPSGRTVSYARDIAGRIASLTTTLDDATQTLAGDIEYQPFGPLASLAYGNGIPLIRTFDRDHRLTAQTAGMVQDLAFRLDPNGNITDITNPLDPNRDQDFAYDPLDRLTEAHGGYGELRYSYDAAGNRLSRTRNGIAEPYTYAADSHHLLQSVDGGTRNYRYDANGNTTDNTDFGFIYGDHDRLTAVTQAGTPLATYTYNGRGERVRKVVGEDPPDYLALATEQEALAAAHRSEAERTEAQARALEDSARASEAQAASKQGEADTLRQAAAAHRTEAEGLDRRAALREQYATPWRTLAQSLRSRIVEPPRNFIQRLLNAFYRALADRSQVIADSISAQAEALRMQAQALRDTAGSEEEQAQDREAEATALLAEATETREKVARLRTEADAFIARAQTAEALAAEYSALAEHPPSAQIATHYLYDPAGRLLGEYDDAGQVEREYVYLEGMPLALMAPNGIYYYHTDHLGTPQSLTDSDQTVVWQAHHDLFGRASVTNQAVTNNLRFPGQYFDTETGLHYNYFRDYDPSVGRYIQSDPIGLAGGINTYTYVGSNPLTRIDPTGNCAPCIAIITVCVGGTLYLAAQYLDPLFEDAVRDRLEAIDEIVGSSSSGGNTQEALRNYNDAASRIGVTAGALGASAALAAPPPGSRRGVSLAAGKVAGKLAGEGIKLLEEIGKCDGQCPEE
jgi:RHS repeat-associated protein